MKPFVILVLCFLLVSCGVLDYKPIGYCGKLKEIRGVSSNSMGGWFSGTAVVTTLVFEDGRIYSVKSQPQGGFMIGKTYCLSYTKWDNTFRATEEGR